MFPADAASIKATLVKVDYKVSQTSDDDFYENYTQKTEKNVAKTRKDAEEFLTNHEDIVRGARPGCESLSWWT